VGDLDETTVWHADGHRIYLQLNRNELVILSVHCPGTGECAVGRFDCIVDWFMKTYGLDCNVGVSEIQSDMEIAWSAQGDLDDPDLSQVWIIPLADEAFAAWLTQQQVGEESPEDVSRPDDSDPSPD